jgi:diguanylate cyclase (GGDEF)-like protein
LALLTSPERLPGGRTEAGVVPVRRDVVVRLAAALFVGSGILGFVSAAILPEGRQRSITVAVGLAALLIGGCTWLAPWERWSPRASFWLAPAALLLIAVANAFGSREPYDYAVFFVIVHAWLGLAHPRRSSLLLAPLTAVAYAVPLFSIAQDLGTALATGLVVVPACVLVGEGIAWMMSRIQTSEALGRRLSEALERERAALDRIRDVHGQLEFLAFHDAVTHLPNRAFFEQHLKLALARARRSDESVVVCAFDLDKFKLVNDTLGHAAGDELLREVAARLGAILREGDVVARVGGDEFLLMLPSGPGVQDADSITDHLDAIARRIGSALDPVVQIGELDLSVSASLGFAVYPRDGADPDALLRQADARMYRGKRERGPIVMTSPAPAEENELAMSTRLRASAKAGAWELHYQPIVELILGKTVGAEALVRWDDPASGLRPPDEFLSLVEELGLESAMTEWVIEELGRTCEAWQRAHLLDQLTMVTVNMSPRELWHPSLEYRLGSIVERLGRPNLLVLEVTESALAMDPSRARDLLAALRAHGVRIALDNFGTGYSSLSRMRALPIDILKIDRSFIGDVHRDEVARQIVRSVIRLASSLGMVPVAQGVETERQLEIVVEEGCALAQGFLFGPPVAAEPFAATLVTPLDIRI